MQLISYRQFFLLIGTLLLSAVSLVHASERREAELAQLKSLAKSIRHTSLTPDNSLTLTEDSRATKPSKIISDGYWSPVSAVDKVKESQKMASAELAGKEPPADDVFWTLIRRTEKNGSIIYVLYSIQKIREHECLSHLESFRMQSPVIVKKASDGAIPQEAEFPFITTEACVHGPDGVSYKFRNINTKVHSPSDQFAVR